MPTDAETRALLERTAATIWAEHREHRAEALAAGFDYSNDCPDSDALLFLADEIETLRNYKARVERVKKAADSLTPDMSLQQCKAILSLAASAEQPEEEADD